MSTLALFFGMPGWAEILVLMFVGVLVFGRRLPEVGRNVGRGIVEFKKGIKGIEDEVDEAVDKRPPRIDADQRDVIDTEATPGKTPTETGP